MLIAFNDGNKVIISELEERTDADACMRKCEIPRPKDLCAGGIGGRDESESETNTGGVPPVRVRGPAGLPAHIIMHLCEPLDRRLGGPAPAGIYYLLRFA